MNLSLHGGFTVKTNQMFSVNTTPERHKNVTITGHFGLMLSENAVSKGA